MVYSPEMHVPTPIYSPVVITLIMLIYFILLNCYHFCSNAAQCITSLVWPGQTLRHFSIGDYKRHSGTCTLQSISACVKRVWPHETNIIYNTSTSHYFRDNTINFLCNKNQERILFTLGKVYCKNILTRA